jgi:hypothetical protein
MSKELCPDCANRNGCGIARMANNSITCCTRYKTAQPLTDKQRVERAKGEIEAVMNQLQTDCDMKPDRALVFWSLQADGWKCEISMK